MTRHQRQQQQLAEISAAAKLQAENKDKLETALGRARRALMMGDRNGAVQTLEAVRDVANIQSEIGGEVILELAMALETVNRQDDARKLYGLLITKCGNDKIRRSALQLLQGLDIVSKLRKDITLDTSPIMDMENMAAISEKLREGLRNEWDDYKKKSSKEVKPWYDMDDEAGRSLERVGSFQDAYYLSLRSINPLKKIPSLAFQQMFRRFYVTNDTVKMNFINSGAGVKLNSTSELVSSYYRQLNGTWEIVVSLRDKAPYAAKRFESGAVRASFFNAVSFLMMRTFILHYSLIRMPGARKRFPDFGVLVP